MNLFPMQKKYRLMCFNLCIYFKRLYLQVQKRSQKINGSPLHLKLQHRSYAY